MREILAPSAYSHCKSTLSAMLLSDVGGPSSCFASAIVDLPGEVVHSCRIKLVLTANPLAGIVVIAPDSMDEKLTA